MESPGVLRKLATGTAVAAICALAPAVAQAKTETASARGVKATFSYKAASLGDTNMKLTISRQGKIVYSHAVSDSNCPSPCSVGNPSGKSVHVRDLSHNGREEVLLDLFTGGAHCCSILEIFSYSAAQKTYTKYSYDFGDPGYSLTDLKHNGRLEFVTADDNFAYAWASYAASGLPIQVLSFSGGRLHNITRSYPTLIAKDANVWLSAYKSVLKTNTDANGEIAAWAADEELLGHGNLVAQTLHTELKAGHLNSHDSVYPSGKKFITALMKLLKKLGYTH